MTRRKTAEVQSRIAETAAIAFATWGFQRTQVRDIVAASGLSSRTIYRYTETKAGILELGLRAGLHLPLPPVESPTGCREPAEILGWLTDYLGSFDPIPTLRLVATSTAPPARVDFETVLREYWDMLYRLWRAVRIVDRSKREWPELLALMNERVHRPIWHQFATLLERCGAAGVIGRVDDPEAMTHCVSELLAWAAVHRRLNVPDSGLDETRARDAALGLVRRGLGLVDDPAAVPPVAATSASLRQPGFEPRG